MAAAFASAPEAARRPGVAMITPKRGIEILERLMMTSAANVMVNPMRWSDWARLYPAFVNSPLLQDVVSGNAVGSTRLTGGSASLTREALLGERDDRRASLLRAYVAEQVGAVIGVTPETLEVDQPITTMGLDSLMAVELKTRFETTLGLAVPVVHFLEGPTVETLSAVLLDRLAKTAADDAWQVVSVAAARDGTAMLEHEIEEGRI
jgi:aryl carrier-like protein